MAATSSGDSYYCHVCETEVVPNLQDFTCSACHSGFIEAVSPGSGLSSNQTELDAWQIIRQLWEGSLSDEFVRYLSTSREDLSSTDDESLERESLARRSRRSTRASNQRSTRERVYTRVPDGRRGFSTRIQLSSMDHPFRLPFLSTFGSADGDMQNFVFNRAMFDQFITVLMNELQVGPPPAPEAAIADLPINVLTEEQALKLGICSICFDDFKESESVIKLPCAHIYHQNCVTTWLKQHGTCPVCRKDLAGHDTSRFEDPTPNMTGNNDGSSSSTS
uniref:RING-type E3 ubiquitin transferase n=1 Tax=Schistosoma japonicum TaxID=6182 RepID=C1LDS6_SCHJA|nr:Heavy metal transport/detoxification protein,domain-containing protein [Schistosoma japonicum]